MNDNNKYFFSSLSDVHSLNLWIKFSVLLMILPGVLFLIEPIFLFIPALFILFLIIASKINFFILWLQSRTFLFFFFIGTIIFSIFFGKGEFMNRLYDGLIWALRFDLVILSAIFLTIIIDPIEIPMAMNQIGIPHRFGITIMVAIRMIPLIKSGIVNVIFAQKARGLNWSINYKNITKFPFKLISLMVPIVFLSLEASVSLSDTLIARGYNPYGSITKRPFKWKKFDIYICIISILLILVFIFLSKLIR